MKKFRKRRKNLDMVSIDLEKGYNDRESCGESWICFKRINSSYIRIKIDLIYDVTRIRLTQS